MNRKQDVIESSPESTGEVDPLIVQIVAARKRTGLSQKDAAARLGITSVGLCYIEKGAKNPSLPMLRAMASLYGTTFQIGSESDHP